MATISTVCSNLFTQTNLAELPQKGGRALRRNLARVVYRQARHPGLVNPQGPDEKPVRKRYAKTTRCAVQKPQVYKFRDPRISRADRKITRDMVPNIFKYSQTRMRKSGNPCREFGKIIGRI